MSYMWLYIAHKEQWNSDTLIYYGTNCKYSWFCKLLLSTPIDEKNEKRFKVNNIRMVCCHVQVIDNIV